MKIPMGAWKAVALVPAFVASGVLWLMLLVLMPPILGLAALVTGGALLAMLAAGALEERAVPLLTRSRAATPAELNVLAAALHTHGDVGRTRTSVLVRTRPRPSTTTAVAVGRSSMVVTPWLIDALDRRWITPEEATSLLVHADIRQRAAGVPSEVAVLAFTTPWRAIAAFAGGVGRFFGWFPFVGFAWSVRGVVGAVAVVQSSVEGRAWAGILAGLIVALTYLMPAARRARDTALEAEADRQVAARGLGTVLAAMLRRFQVPVGLARLQRLENRSGAAPVPVLQLAAFSPN